MKALAIDLGGSHATCALVEDGVVRASRTVAVDGAISLGRVLPLCVEAFHGLSEECGVELSACEGLAFGFPGIVDAKRGRVLSTSKKYTDAPALDLTAWCQSALRLPLRLENDARLALLGERHAGAARGFDDVVMVTLGTGIGGAAMIGGQLLRGKHFQAGCLGGHFPVLFDGRKCSCGNLGCVEAEASTWSLPLICRDWPGFDESLLAQEETIDFARLFKLVEAEDCIATEIYQRCLKVWAAGATGLIHAYDPEVVVFGGGVMERQEFVLPFIESHVHEHAWTPWGKVKVCAAELGQDAPLVGAVPLLQEQTR